MSSPIFQGSKNRIQDTDNSLSMDCPDLIYPEGFIIESLSLTEVFGKPGLVISKDPFVLLYEKLKGRPGSSSPLIDNLTLRDDISSATNRIHTTMGQDVTDTDVRSYIDRGLLDLDEDQVELLIRLLTWMKKEAVNLVFAVIVRYQIGEQVTTLGFSGQTSEPVEDLCT